MLPPCPVPWGQVVGSTGWPRFRPSIRYGCPGLVGEVVVDDVVGDANVPDEHDGFVRQLPARRAGETRAKPRSPAVRGGEGARSVPVWCTNSDSFSSRESALDKSCLFIGVAGSFGPQACPASYERLDAAVIKRVAPGC